jgi:hypothetical protein
MPGGSCLVPGVWIKKRVNPFGSTLETKGNVINILFYISQLMPG